MLLFVVQCNRVHLCIFIFLTSSILLSYQSLFERQQSQCTLSRCIKTDLRYNLIGSGGRWFKTCKIKSSSSIACNLNVLQSSANPIQLGNPLVWVFTLSKQSVLECPASTEPCSLLQCPAASSKWCFKCFRTTLASPSENVLLVTSSIILKVKSSWQERSNSIYTCEFSSAISTTPLAAFTKAFLNFLYAAAAAHNHLWLTIPVLAPLYWKTPTLAWMVLTLSLNILMIFSIKCYRHIKKYHAALYFWRASLSAFFTS